MKIIVDIKRIYYYYRFMTKEWVVECNACTNNCSLSYRFANKKLNKAKKQFVKWAMNGILKDEIEYLFRTKKLTIEPYFFKPTSLTDEIIDQFNELGHKQLVSFNDI